MTLSPEQRWALRLLADSVHGHTEAVMLAHSFTVDQLAVLVRDGLATAEPDMLAGRPPMKVVRLRITDAGRRAVGE
jgi:hypothetical protein